MDMDGEKWNIHTDKQIQRKFSHLLNICSDKTSYPTRQFEPDDTFPLGAPRLSSLPLCSGAQIANTMHMAQLATCLSSNNEGGIPMTLAATKRHGDQKSNICGSCTDHMIAHIDG